MEKHNPNTEPNGAMQTLLAVCALGLIVFAVYYTFVSPSASGQPISLWTYFALWAREFLLLAGLAVGIICIAIGWFIDRVRRAIGPP